MRFLFRNCDRADIERISCCCFEGADSAFAEDHAPAAVHKQIFRRIQPFADRRRHSALQKNGSAGFRNAFQKIVVLAVSCPDLNAVRNFSNVFQGRDSHDFGHNGNVITVLDVLKDIKSFLTESLKIIRRCSGLVSSAAEDPCSGCGQQFRRSLHLFRGFDGARTGDDLELLSADDFISDLEFGIFPLEFAAREFVFLLDRHDGFHIRKIFEDFQRHVDIFIPDRTEDRMLHALDQAGFIPHLGNHFFNPFDLIRGAVRFENNNHFSLSLYSSACFPLQNYFSVLYY